MMPTSSYFRSINCPFFLSGLCERPFCHFKHVKPVGDNGSARFSKQSDFVKIDYNYSQYPQVNNNSSADMVFIPTPKDKLELMRAQGKLAPTSTILDNEDELARNGTYYQMPLAVTTNNGDDAISGYKRKAEYLTSDYNESSSESCSLPKISKYDPIGGRSKNCLPGERKSAFDSLLDDNNDSISTYSPLLSSSISYKTTAVATSLNNSSDHNLKSTISNTFSASKEYVPMVCHKTDKHLTTVNNSQSHQFECYIPTPISKQSNRPKLPLPQIESDSDDDVDVTVIKKTGDVLSSLRKDNNTNLQTSTSNVVIEDDEYDPISETSSSLYIPEYKPTTVKQIKLTESKDESAQDRFQNESDNNTHCLPSDKIVSKADIDIEPIPSVTSSNFKQDNILSCTDQVLTNLSVKIDVVSSTDKDVIKDVTKLSKNSRKHMTDGTDEKKVHNNKKCKNKEKDTLKENTSTDSMPPINNSPKDSVSKSKRLKDCSPKYNTSNENTLKNSSTDITFKDNLSQDITPKDNAPQNNAFKVKKVKKSKDIRDMDKKDEVVVTKPEVVDLKKVYHDLFGDDDDDSEVVGQSQETSCVVDKNVHDQVSGVEVSIEKDKCHNDSQLFNSSRSTENDNISSAAGRSSVLFPNHKPPALTAQEVMMNRIRWYEDQKAKRLQSLVTSNSTKSCPTSKIMTLSSSSGSRYADCFDDVPAAVINAPIVPERPKLPRDSGTKIPLEIRMRYLSLFVDDCLKIYTDPADAYERALCEEKNSYDKSSNRNVYLNVIINARKRLLNEILQPRVNTTTPATTTEVQPLIRTISHDALLNRTNSGQKTSFLTDTEVNAILCKDKFQLFYKYLLKYLMTEEQLRENGYPRVNKETNEVDLPGSEEKLKSITPQNQNLTGGTARICCRCGLVFTLPLDGSRPVSQECSYHWGKSWKRKVAGSGVEQRYTCCEGDVSSKGCQVADYHVHDWNKYGDLQGYRLSSSSKIAKKNKKRQANVAEEVADEYAYGVFSMDCEMIYTCDGFELARVTVMNPLKQVVYERLVKPHALVLDWNTRFSGLKASDFEVKGQSTAISLEDAQKDLRRIFHAKSIIVGHSLECDLTALKLIHDFVVDTSIVFPHRLGTPYKRALKTLSIEILEKIIQDDESGHDSKQDANACMELMLYQVREDYRKERRTSIS